MLMGFSFHNVTKNGLVGDVLKSGDYFKESKKRVPVLSGDCLDEFVFEISAC